MGQTLHHRLADLLGAARALLPLRHHQLKLAQQLVVDVIVALLPDGGERYLSTPMYQGE